jgi:transposase-like protein
MPLIAIPFQKLVASGSVDSSALSWIWICSSRDRSNNNIVERLHGTIRQRNKVMRGLDDMETAETMRDGLRIYYNFFTPHSALDGKTPAKKPKSKQTRLNGCL